MSRSSRARRVLAVAVLLTAAVSCSPPDGPSCHHLVFLGLQFAAEPPAEVRVDIDGDVHGMHTASEWNEDGDNRLAVVIVYEEEEYPSPPAEIAVAVYELPGEVPLLETTVQPEYQPTGDHIDECDGLMEARMTLDIP